MQPPTQLIRQCLLAELAAAPLTLYKSQGSDEAVPEDRVSLLYPCELFAATRRKLEATDTSQSLHLARLDSYYEVLSL